MDSSASLADDAPTSARWSTHAVEQLLCEVWRDLFGAVVSPCSDFFDLGGDSIAILDMVTAVRQRGLPLRSSMALRHPTPARLAERLTIDEDSPLAQAARPATALMTDPPDTTAPAAGAPVALTAITEAGPAAPLFVVHSTDHVTVEEAAVRSWLSDRPAVGMLPPGMRTPASHGWTDGGLVKAIAEDYLAALREAQPTGPYHLVGFDHAAVLALALARLLRQAEEPVARLVLVRPPALTELAEPVAALHQRRLTVLARRFGLTGDESQAEILALMRRAGWYDPQVKPADLPRLQLLWAELAHAVGGYRPQPYQDQALVCHDVWRDDTAEQGWRQAVPAARFEEFDYQLDSPQPLLADQRLADLMRMELAT